MSRDSKTYCISSTYYSCAHVFYNKSNESTSALLTDCFEGILWRRQLQISVFHHPISFSLKHLNSSTEKDYNCTIKGSVFISLLPHLRLFFILIKVAQLSSSRPSHPSHIIKAWCDLLESKSNLLRMNMFLFLLITLLHGSVSCHDNKTTLKETCSQCLTIIVRPCNDLREFLFNYDCKLVQVAHPGAKVRSTHGSCWK